MYNFFFTVLVITDANGTPFTTVIQTTDSPVSLGGDVVQDALIVSKDGSKTKYNGRAEGLRQWAEKHGLTIQAHNITLDPNKKELVSWK